MNREKIPIVFPITKKELIFLALTASIPLSANFILLSVTENDILSFFIPTILYITAVTIYARVRHKRLLAQLDETQIALLMKPTYETDISKQPKLLKPSSRPWPPLFMYILNIFGILFVLACFSFLMIFLKIRDAFIDDDIIYLSYKAISIDNLMYLNIFVNVLFLIISSTFISLSYRHFVKVFESYAGSPPSCSAWHLFRKLIFPLTDFAFPWQALGALDRAVRFSATNRCGGDLWCKREYKSASYSARATGLTNTFLILCSIVMIMSLSNSLYTNTPRDKWISYMNELVILSSMVCTFALLFVISLGAHFHIISRNIRKIRAITDNPNL